MICNFCKTNEAIKVGTPGFFIFMTGELKLGMAIWLMNDERMEPLVVCLPCLKNLLYQADNEKENRHVD